MARTQRVVSRQFSPAARNFFWAILLPELSIRRAEGKDRATSRFAETENGLDKAKLSVKKQNFVERGGVWSIQNELLVSVYYLAREISPTIEQSDALKFHDISSHAKVYLCNLLARISPKFCRSHYFHGSRGVFFLKNYMNCSFNVLPCKISLKVWKSK